MKGWCIFTGFILLLFIAITLSVPGQSPATHTPHTIAFFKRAQVTFYGSTLVLQQTIQQLDAHQPNTLLLARQALKNCRENYKQLSFFLEYFFTSEAYVFNSPAKYEVEEPDIEYEEPVGLQQVEALLYDKDPFGQQGALQAQMDVITKTAADLPALLYQFNATDEQVLESIRLELIRVMTLYISGYDAPLLKSGLGEAAMALRVMDTVLTPYMSGWQGADSMHLCLKKSVQFLQSDFDSFDRLQFITVYSLPLQQQLTALCHAKGWTLHTIPALDEDAPLFSKAALRQHAFPGGAMDSGLIRLGRRLFFEKGLSGNGQRSCATCHQPDRFFTDGLTRQASLLGGVLPRHTPGLSYAGYQYAQFWDGRAGSPEAQIITVLHSLQEMGANDDTLKQRFPDLDQPQMIAALSAYLRTLAPFNAPFDAYMRGDSTAMNVQQRKGFNLFMGKAQCGTCHFAPLFNGLTPPFYNRTEFEILGVPASNDLQAPIADPDLGRAAVFPIQYYNGAFKTPTVRNTALTAPYMHNGALRTITDVIDFYDKGGGVGIGLSIPNQTLSATPLHLTADEKQAIIAFIGSLTDGQHSF